MLDETNAENGADDKLESSLDNAQADDRFDEASTESAGQDGSGESWRGSGNELGEFDLGLESFESIATENQPDRSRWPLLLAVLALLIAVVVYFGFFRNPESAAPVNAGDLALAPEPQAAPVARTPQPEFELPSLGESDGVLRRMIGQLTSHPELMRWALSDDLLRRFAAAVENVANGVTPVSHLDQIQIEGDFKAIQAGDSFFIDPQSFRRYNGIAAVIDSVDARGAAALYSSFKPLLDKVYQDLGYPGGDFDEVLQRAIAKLVSTPVITGQIDLVRKVSSYEFAVQEVESLEAVQKQLLRFGPDNQRLVLGKIREIARELGFSI
jgi:hypothetical protein